MRSHVLYFCRMTGTDLPHILAMRTTEFWFWFDGLTALDRTAEQNHWKGS